MGSTFDDQFTYALSDYEVKSDLGLIFLGQFRHFGVGRRDLTYLARSNFKSDRTIGKSAKNYPLRGFELLRAIFKALY